MKRVATVAALAGSLWAGECALVEGDRILAADLARERPLFAALDPAAVIGYAPAPGRQRTLDAEELARLARRHCLPEVSLEPVCFERAAETLRPERLVEAMRAALGEPQARIEILDFSRYPVPRGELSLPLAGLASPPPGKPESPVVWRGRVVYDGRRSVAVWARVRISAPRRLVVARRDLVAGRPIQAADIEERLVETFPAQRNGTLTAAAVVGATPRRRIRAGEALEASWLRLPRDVERGDAVTVEVASGAARLLLEGRAETGGRRGEPVAVRNPASGRRFTATVEGPGRASLRVGQGGSAP